MAIDVTVVIPTFCRADFLREALASGLAQEGPTFEIRVVDLDPEGSAQRVVEAQRDPRVSYARAPDSIDACVACQVGLQQAQGRAVLFLDDDDVLAHDALLFLLSPLDRDPKVAVSFGRVLPFGDDPLAMVHEFAFFLDGARAARSWHSRKACLRRLLFGPAPFVRSGILFRRQAALAAGGFDPEIPLVGHTDLFVRLLQKHEYAFVDHEVVRYRVHPDSQMHDPMNQHRLNLAYRQMARNYRSRFGTASFVAQKVAARVFGAV